MSRTCPRVFCVLILALAASACGSGAPAGEYSATFTPTLTAFALPPEATTAPTPTMETAPAEAEPSGEDADPSTESAPEPSEEAAGPATLTPDSGEAGAATPPPAAGSSDVRCNDSLFIEDMTVPDGTILAPGQTFEKTWRLKNIGVCAWTTGYVLGFSHGERMMGAESHLSKPVSPGYTIDVTVQMTAPMENGWYGGWWRLRSNTGENFGDFVFVSILVSDGRESPTPGG
ncbi:MAG: hypothetical protein JW929_16445 [Anaerolineales bacterium]|nr:hypothetical protein [Anaerolineales bacterium]